MNDDGALHGVRVLDSSQMLSGPICGMRLGDLGADVVKIEPPRGEHNRHNGFGAEQVRGETPTFMGLNRNKRSVVLDLKQPSGLAAFIQLVKEADRRFREEHQPDLLRKASRYLSRLTGGRYDRLLVDEGGSDLFQLVGPGLPAPIPLARPVSTGTLEQAYLSLRLAIVDHLDEGKERLPLFIDEAFVNWDDGRREQGFEVLKEVAGTRQVFAFTCHPEMAARLESLGARVLLLDR